MNTSLRLPVGDQSQAGEARRMAASWARERGYGTALMGTVALVVTELAKNLALHTRGGVLLLRNLSTPGNCGVEVLSVNSGPGSANFSEYLRDGFSTAGTSGIGLGVVKRASQVFEVHSQLGVGTVLLSEIWTKPPAASLGRFRCSAASVPLAGEQSCGDSWAVQSVRADRVRLIVADGLGHGPLAADASRKAVEVFVNGAAQPLLRLLEIMHSAMRATRGAAVAVAEIDDQQVTYAGIGNISATIQQREKSVSLVSLNGTMGVQYRHLQQFTYPWSPGASLVMHSDGVKANWQLNRYAALSERHPGLIAGVLHRDFQRANDDSTVVVLRAHP